MNSLIAVKMLIRVLAILSLIFAFCPAFHIASFLFSFDVSVSTAIEGLEWFGEKLIPPLPAMLVSYLIPAAITILLFIRKIQDITSAQFALIFMAVDLVLWFIFGYAVMWIADDPKALDKVNSRASIVSDMENALSNAKAEESDAKDNVSAKEASLNNANSSVFTQKTVADDARKNVSSAKDDADSAKALLTDAETVVSERSSVVDDLSDINEAFETYFTAKTAFENAVLAKDAADKALEEAQSETLTAEERAARAKAAAESIKKRIRTDDDDFEFLNAYLDDIDEAKDRLAAKEASLEDVRTACDEAARISDAADAAYETAKLNLFAAATVCRQMLDVTGSDSYAAGSGASEIRANGSLDYFRSLSIDGVDVDPSYYTAEAGSTILTISGDYMDGLKSGIHMITIDFEYGSIGLTTEIERADSPAESHQAVYQGSALINNMNLQEDFINTEDLNARNVFAANAGTGDNVQAGLYGALMAVGLLGSISSFLKRKRAH